LICYFAPSVDSFSIIQSTSNAHIDSARPASRDIFAAARKSHVPSAGELSQQREI